ncbi:MAG: hypothetical protein OFPI_31250 [Osedax symbiont Rs2]|nr:MAG: hypothetical protein OFPI_31250 [Osedax symbiont Rs2]
MVNIGVVNSIRGAINIFYLQGNISTLRIGDRVDTSDILFSVTNAYSTVEFVDGLEVTINNQGSYLMMVCAPQ